MQANYWRIEEGVGGDMQIEERRMRAFENGLLKGIFKPKNTQLHNCSELSSGMYCCVK
jgi:hypothetical protein